MISLRNRSEEPELIDDPSLKPEMLNAVLKDVSLANRLLGGNRIIINAVKQILQRAPEREYSIMDVGCGDGEMLRQLAQIFRLKKFSTRFIGLDLSKTAIELARQYSGDFPEIEYHIADVLEDDIQALKADIILCTLTLHHVPSEQIPRFLNNLAGISNRAIIVNDLHRSPLAYYLFKIFSAIFIKTKIARHDGLVSIKRGFKRNELIAFSRQVPAYYPKIKWKWAFRYLLILAPSDHI